MTTQAKPDIDYAARYVGSAIGEAEAAIRTFIRPGVRRDGLLAKLHAIREEAMEVMENAEKSA